LLFRNEIKPARNPIEIGLRAASIFRIVCHNRYPIAVKKVNREQSVRPNPVNRISWVEASALPQLGPSP